MQKAAIFTLYYAKVPASVLSAKKQHYETQLRLSQTYLKNQV